MELPNCTLVRTLLLRPIKREQKCDTKSGRSSNRLFRGIIEIT